MTNPNIASLHLPDQHFHVVTGRLAADGIQRYLAELSQRLHFKYSVDVLPISVAALLTPQWIANRIDVSEAATAVLIPGYCDKDITPLIDAVSIPVYVGPRDFRLIEAMLTGEGFRRDGYGDYSIEIIAEINHAPRLTMKELLATASRFVQDGADVVDIGCDPGDTWNGIADCVRAFRDLGIRVSVDSFNPKEVSAAVKAGAELVLSVNRSNREAAVDWGCEVIAIPDELGRKAEGLSSQALRELADTVEFLQINSIPYRIDPILEPIGCGFADSLARYVAARREFPDVEMMMGIGNLTELTDVDSPGVNVLLLGVCEELGIRSVLTTEVINWARTSVRECDLGRRLVHYAIAHGTVPKHIEPDLVMLREPKLLSQSDDELTAIARSLKDPNYRIFAESEKLHLMNGDMYLHGTDPFEIFERLMESKPKNVDPAHAFYLGYEMAKAVTALTLGKQYRQDQALNWGFLTKDEVSHRSRKEADE